MNNLSFTKKPLMEVDLITLPNLAVMTEKGVSIPFLILCLAL